VVATSPVRVSVSVMMCSLFSVQPFSLPSGNRDRVRAEAAQCHN
jgi:hypothetical protein